MCGRSSLTLNEKQLEERFGSTFYSEDLERYNPLPTFNIAPTHLHPVISMDDPEHFVYKQWGLIPFWAKAASIGSKMINARVETILEKSVFKSTLKKQRCLVPFDGYYEWMKHGKTKIPHRITLKDSSAFAIAGLSASWKSPTGEQIESFTVITQPASASIEHIHDRMPAILLKEQERLWLSDEISEAELLQLIQPLPDELLRFYTVSDAVNKVSNNDPTLIEPFEYNEGNDKQLSLF